MKTQRGITMIGLLLVAIVVAFLGIVTIKVVPTVLEYQSILKAVKKSRNGRQQSARDQNHLQQSHGD